MSIQIPVAMSDPNNLKWCLDFIRSTYKSWMKQGERKKADQLLSTVIRELLSCHPNITCAEADMKALEITGERPSAGLIWARDALLVARTEKERRYKTRENPPREAKARKKVRRSHPKSGKRSIRVRVLL